MLNTEFRSEWLPSTITIRGCSYCPLQVFADRDKCLRHVREHVLDEVESRIWAVVIEDPDIGEQLQDAHARNRLYYAAAHNEEVLQRLYIHYTKVIQNNLQDACLLGWKAVKEWETGWVGVALGTCGLLIVAETGTVVTAFFPRHMKVEARQQKGGRRMRSGTGPKENAKLREYEWSKDKWLYYRAFRPARQFIQQCQQEWFPRSEALRPRDNDYAMLKTKLPRLHALTFVNWSNLRQQCRSSHLGCLSSQ